MSKLLFALSFVSFAAFAGPNVEVARDGDVVRVDATISVAVKPDLAWAVLTDYNHLADFVPDLFLSRVISHEPLRVEQKGESGFLVWRFPIEVVFEIKERPPQVIAFESISGNLKNMRGEWRITETDREVELGYSATMESDFWIPPIIGAAIIRRDIQRRIEGVAKEMLSRSGREH